MQKSLNGSLIMDSSSGLCQLDNVIISDKLQLSNGSVITTGNCVAGALIFTWNSKGYCRKDC